MLLVFLSHYTPIFSSLPLFVNATPNLVSLLSSLPLALTPLFSHVNGLSSTRSFNSTQPTSLNNTNNQIQWLELSKPHESPLVERLPESSVCPICLVARVQQLIISRHQGCPKDRIQDCWWSYRWCQEAPQVQARYRRPQRDQAIPEVSLSFPMSNQY